MRHRMIDICGRLALVAATGLGACGCQGPVRFPEHPMPSPPGSPGAARYDVDGDGRADFFTYADSSGRVCAIAYDHTRDGQPDWRVELDALPFERCRHLVIILDGFGYDVVREVYESGGLRLFHPPRRVIAPYPAMTDPAIEDLLGYAPAPAMESVYYDRARNELTGGSMSYLSGRNQPYNRLLHYRAGTLVDALGYLRPRAFYEDELEDLKRLFDRRRTQEVLAYVVSSAGISTRHGAEGQKQALRQLERMVWQIIWETRGLVKVTLISDHGHSYTPATRLPLEQRLAERGWRIGRRLDGPRDVVYVQFGLLTCACFWTLSPAALANDLVRLEGVELASYADGEAVVVLRRADANAVASASITRQGDCYGYQPAAGDPLRLRGVLAALTPDPMGRYDADELLAATVEADYPAALERLWRAHFAQVEHPPDVIVSLEDRFYSGSASFASTVAVASTHGGLNRANSTAFIMSTAGPLPEHMRSRDVPANLRQMTGRPFPLGR